jgi:hypothetical protein
MIGTTIGSVFAAGYTVNVPLLGTSGAPALSGTQFTGIITVLYADGMPVVLESNRANLQLCVISCIVEPVTLKQTAPGTYAYSFTPPSSLNGTITITVLAGSLADDNGRIFPSVNTQIGTYATPGLTSSSAPANAPPGQALPASPMPQSNNVVGQAVSIPQQPSQDSTTVEVVLAVTTILLVAGALLILPSRRH